MLTLVKVIAPIHPYEHEVGQIVNVGANNEIPLTVFFPESQSTQYYTEEEVELVRIEPEPGDPWMMPDRPAMPVEEEPVNFFEMLVEEEEPAPKPETVTLLENQVSPDFWEHLLAAVQTGRKITGFTLEEDPQEILPIAPQVIDNEEPRQTLTWEDIEAAPTAFELIQEELRQQAETEAIEESVLFSGPIDNPMIETLQIRGLRIAPWGVRQDLTTIYIAIGPIALINELRETIEIIYRQRENPLTRLWGDNTVGICDDQGNLIPYADIPPQETEDHEDLIQEIETQEPVEDTQTVEIEEFDDRDIDDLDPTDDPILDLNDLFDDHTYFIIRKPGSPRDGWYCRVLTVNEDPRQRGRGPLYRVNLIHPVGMDVPAVATTRNGRTMPESGIRSYYADNLTAVSVTQVPPYVEDEQGILQHFRMDVAA